MKKIMIGILITLVALSALSVSALAGAPPSARGVKGPYEGTFRGYISGEKGSRASLTLVLTHRDGIVNGTATIGDGLYVSAGRCGGGNLPGATQYIRGRSVPNNPNKILAQTQFTVSGFDIGVDLESNISRTGKVLTVDAEIDLPWICGKDPALSGTIYRVR